MCLRLRLSVLFDTIKRVFFNKTETRRITLYYCSWLLEDGNNSLGTKKNYTFFGTDNPDFKSKSEAILNKFSLDLVLLLIEEAKALKTIKKKKNNNLQSEIQKVKQKIFHINDIDNLSKSHKQMKLEKIRWDQEDNKKEALYTTNPFPMAIDPDSHGSSPLTFS